MAECVVQHPKLPKNKTSECDVNTDLVGVTVTGLSRVGKEYTNAWHLNEWHSSIRARLSFPYLA